MGYMGDLIIICPKPHFTYLRGTIAISGVKLKITIVRVIEYFLGLTTPLTTPYELLSKCEKHPGESRSRKLQKP